MLSDKHILAQGRVLRGGDILVRHRAHIADCIARGVETTLASQLLATFERTQELFEQGLNLVFKCHETIPISGPAPQLGGSNGHPKTARLRIVDGSVKNASVTEVADHAKLHKQYVVESCGNKWKVTLDGKPLHPMLGRHFYQSMRRATRAAFKLARSDWKYGRSARVLTVELDGRRVISGVFGPQSLIRTL